MKISILILLTISISFSYPVTAQMRNWGKLQIPVSEGWSLKQQAGFVQLSNYNLVNAEPVTITLYENQPYTGKPDTLFAHAWKNFATIPPVSPEVPRWRRFYTEEGMLIQQGFVEFTGEGGPLYRQLNVIILEDSYQVCILETSSSKIYRLIQSEWMEKLQGVTQISGAKR